MAVFFLTIKTCFQVSLQNVLVSFLLPSFFLSDASGQLHFFNTIKEIVVRAFHPLTDDLRKQLLQITST